jgi:LysR family transcriptional regulator, regulator for bpeEF and oprC
MEGKMAKFSQYKVFVTIVEAGSLSAAARRLNVSASAISKQITSLEHTVKVKLFDRSNRNVKVTEPGRQFYEQCKQILNSVIDAEHNLLAGKESVSGKLSITMSKSLVRSNIMPVLKQFSDKHTDIRFNINLSDSFKDLHESNIDFSFRLGRLDDSSRLIAIPLTQTKLIFCATQDYLKQYGQPQSLENLAQHRVITQPTANLSEEVRRFLKRRKLSIHDENFHTADDIEAVYQAVHSGLGMGLMLDISVENELKTNLFVNALPKVEFPAKKLYLLYKRHALTSQKHRAFKESIKNVF